jgi:TonB family protein
MFLRIMRRCTGLVLLAVILSVQSPMLIQTAAQRKDEEERSSRCDFSRYKPLVISHPLVNAATKKVAAEYPTIAKQAKAQGKVEARILVDRNGDVIDVCVIEGHPLLSPAVKEAALQWKFKKNFGLTHKQKGYIQASIYFTFRLVD